MGRKNESTDNNNYVQNLIGQFAEDNINRVALMLYDGMEITEISYNRLAKDILYAVSFFKENMIISNHVALVGANSYEWIITFFAITASGNTAVIMNPDLPQEVLLQQCKMADVSMVIGDEKVISKLSMCLPCCGYSSLRENKMASVSELVSPNPNNTTVLLFTSGTTGESKVVELTYANMTSSIRSADGVFSAPEIDRVMTVLPLFHIAGLRGSLAMLHRYKTLCIGRGAMYLFKDMPVFSPSYVLLVPMIAESIVKIIRHTSKKEDRQKYLGTNLKRICVGGATIDPKICRYLMDEGFVIDSGYAMTETTGVGTWGQWDEKHFNTIGKLSGEIQCRIENGELLFKGPSIMKGYYKNSEATELVVKDGWLYSGDLGFCDEDGYYYITGRKKNLIIMPNGEKINPEEMEAYFRTCESILECIVYYNGTAICADIYSSDSEKSEKFIEAYNDSMPLSYQVRKVRYYSEPLKKTGSGKVIRKGTMP